MGEGLGLRALEHMSGALQTIGLLHPNLLSLGKAQTHFGYALAYSQPCSLPLYLAIDSETAVSFIYCKDT
jgi:hypothetical protein